MKRRRILTIVLIAGCFGMDSDCEQRVCCLPDGTCVQDFNACFTGGGFLADSCEECQMGLRCCLRSGNCVEVLSIADCNNMAGTIVDICDDSCQPRAQNCCFPNGDCREFASAGDCASQGGTNFIDRPCDDCPSPNDDPIVDVCCFPDGDCRPATEDDPCVNQGGSLLLGKTCDDCPNPNDTGACCAGGDCADGFLRADCASGDFFAGENCSNVECPEDDD